MITESPDFSRGEYITAGEVTFTYKGKTYTYNITDDISNFTANDNGTDDTDDDLLTVNGEMRGFLEILTKNDNDYYLIGSEKHLRLLANYVNAGNDCAGLKFKLSDNITLNGDWTPIGGESHPFKGIFDGDGKIISGLTINSTEDNQGLFGYAEGATISNVTLSGVNVTGGNNVGALVGNNVGGTVSNNKVDGTIGGSSNVGALVGNNSGTVSGNYYHSDTTDKNATKVYKITLNGVTASGAITIGNETFAPENSELSTKSDYVIEGDLTVTEGKTFTATLDKSKRYVFGNATDGYTLADEQNTADYPDLTEVFVLTAPANFKISDPACTDASKIISIGEEKYYLQGAEVSFSVTSATEPRHVVDTVNDTAATNEKFTATINADIALELTYHVQLSDGGDNYTVAQGERVIFGGGSDTVTIGNGVTSFTVENFGASDEIVGITGETLTAVDGGITDGTVTIYGLEKNSTEYGWTVDDGVKYQTWETGGVNLSGTKINYIASTTADKTDVFALSGLKDNLTAAQKWDEYYQKATENDSTTFTYHDAAGGETFTITGLGDAKLGENISVDASGKVTVFNGALPTNPANNAEISLNGAGYTLDFDNTIAQDATNHSDGWSGNTFTEDYTLAHWTKDGNSYKFSEQVGGHKFTISGLKENSQLANDISFDATDYKFTILSDDVLPTSGEVSIAGEAGVGNITAETGELVLGANVTKPTDISEGWKDYTYTASGKTAGYSLSDGKISYAQQTGGEQFTISGVTNTNGVTVNGGNVKVSASALNTTATESYKVTLTPAATTGITNPVSYSLSLDGVNTNGTEILVTLNSGVYTSAYTPAHFSGSGNEYTFTPETGKTTFIISGLGDGAKLGENVTVENNTVEILSGAMTSTHDKISVGDKNYDLQLKDSLAETINFNQSSNAVTLSGTTAGYAKNDNGEYVWQDKVGGEELTITGLKDGATLTADMFTRKDNVITFKPTQELLPDNPTTLSITGGVIDTSALTVTPAESAHWSGSTWISDKTASSWTSGASTVTYTPATGGEDLFKIENATLTNVTPVKQSDGSYKITLPADSFQKSGSITITKIQSPATLEFSGIGTAAQNVDAKLTAAGTYTSAYTPEYFKPSTSGNVTTYTYTPTTDKETFTINGLGLTADLTGTAIDTYLTISNTVKVEKLGVGLANYSGTGITLTGTAKNLELADDLKLTEDKQHAATFTKGTVSDDVATFSYKGAYNDAHFSDNGTFNPSTESAAGTFNVTNLKADSDPAALLNQFNNKTLTLTGNNVAGKTVTISDGYKLAIGNGVTASTTINQGWSAVAGNAANYYAAAGKTQGYELTNDTTLTYIETTMVPTLILSGVTSTGGFTVDGTNVKFTSAALANITAGGATLSAGNFVADSTDAELKESVTYAADSWNGFDDYAAEAKTAGYSLESGKLSNVTASGAKAFTVSGTKTTNGIVVNDANKTVTLKSGNLDSNAVSFSSNAGGYSFALDGVNASTSTNAHFSGNTYKSASRTAGYALSSDKKSIAYTAAVAESDLFTVSGVKSTDGIVVNESNKTVTLKSDNLGTSNVSFSANNGGYSFALDGVNASTSTNAHFSGNTYKSASRTAGYALSSDKKSIAYTAAVAESDLFTLTGIKTTDGIAVNTSKKTVTLSANNLNGKNVTISGDYKLKLGSDVTTSAVKSNGAFTTFASGTATYTTAFFSDYYSLKNNKITYTAASNGKAITIAGLNTKSKLSTIKSGISVAEQQDGSFKITFNKANVLASKAPTVTADKGISYTLAVAKALKPTALAPDWKVSSTNAILKSDTSAGYSVVDNQIVYSAKKTGSAQLVLGGLAKNASLSAPTIKLSRLILPFSEQMLRSNPTRENIPLNLLAT